MGLHTPKRAWILIILLIMSVAGAFLVSYGMRWGPWTNDDSAEYFEAARNIAAGLGPVLVRASGAVMPLSSRPPFYSFVLSVGPLLGINIFTYARFLDVLFYAVFLFLVGFTTYQFTGNILLSSSLTAYFLTSTDFIQSFTSGLAEPLFFVFAIASLYLLLTYFQTGKRINLVASSIMAGLSLVTRLSGGAMVGAGAVCMLLFGPRRIGRRFKDAVLYGVIGVLGAGLWLYQVSIMGESAGLYTFDFGHLWDRLASSRVGFVNFGWSLLPYASYVPEPTYRIKFVILLLVGLLFVLLLRIALRRKGAISFSRWRRNAHLQIAGIFTVLTLVYIVIFIFSRLFMRLPRAEFIPRHLSLVGLGVLVAVFTLVAFFIDSFDWPKRANLLLVVLVLGLILPSVQPSVTLLTQYHEQGSGFSREYWHHSQLMQVVQELPEDSILISNESEAILLWLNRPSYRVPEIWHRKHIEPFTQFGEIQDDPIEKIFREEEAALILFSSVADQFFVLYGHDSKSRLDAFVDGLFTYAEREDGAIYFYREPSEN
jgi:hypothetical protein